MYTVCMKKSLTKSNICHCKFSCSKAVIFIDINYANKVFILFVVLSSNDNKDINVLVNRKIILEVQLYFHNDIVSLGELIFLSFML